MSLIRSPAFEWRPIVRVSRVLPGAIDTPMPAGGLRQAGQATEDGRSALDVGIPPGRIGQPREVAQAIMLLADADRSSVISGQTLIAAGGVLASPGTA